ncbi:MAG: hypothetical protein K8T89_03500 [Planctomycetes bacterium]|nr:hypothetical protein [Planctomycetota bacterium]
MISIVLFFSSIFAAETPTPYNRAQQLAIADNLPMVTFVGCERQAVSGAWCCRADGLEGYSSPCIVVAIPSDGKLLWSRTLPATATAAEIVSAFPRVAQASTPDALDEVNAKRSRLGLRPLIRDEGLTAGAAAAAQYRAANRIAGHTSNDFAYLPSGASATSAGCAALEPSWGWQSCCWDGAQWTVAGAAWAMGADGRRYMHIFVR